MALQTAQALQTATQIKCRRCAAEPKLLHRFLNTQTGGTVRIFKCECGEQMWLDESE